MKSSTKNQIQGKLHEIKGKAKEALGKATNKPDLQDEGLSEKLTGKVQAKVGQIQKVLDKRGCPEFDLDGATQKENTVNRTLGIVLIGLGLLGLAWGGFTYTTQEKIVDLGPIQATRDKEHSVPIPPIAGAAAVVGGIVLLVSGKKP